MRAINDEIEPASAFGDQTAASEASHFIWAQRWQFMPMRHLQPHTFRHFMSDKQENNPLHGITLESLLSELVSLYGWQGLAERLPINCFSHEPSMKSSLSFLRRTSWARQKVEALYLASQDSSLMNAEVPVSDEPRKIMSRPQATGRKQGERRPRQGYGTDRPLRADGDQPHAERSPRRDGDRPQAERRPRRDGDRPQGERSSRPYGDRPQGERGPRRDGDRPQGERSSRPYGDRPQSDRGPRRDGDRPQGERSSRPYGDRPQGNRGPRRDGDRPQGERSSRPYGDRPQGERGPRPYGDRPARPYGDRPNERGARSQGERIFRNDNDPVQRERALQQQEGQRRQGGGRAEHFPRSGERQHGRDHQHGRPQHSQRPASPRPSKPSTGTSPWGTPKKKKDQDAE